MKSLFLENFIELLNLESVSKMNYNSHENRLHNIYSDTFTLCLNLTKMQCKLKPPLKTEARWYKVMNGVTNHS